MRLFRFAWHLCLKHSQQTGYSGQQGHTFNEGGSKDHSAADVVSSLGLAGNTFGSALTNLANTNTGSNSGQAGTNGTTQVARAHIQQNVHQLHNKGYLK
jgi:hypothetical protein